MACMHVFWRKLCLSVIILNVGTYQVVLKVYNDACDILRSTLHLLASSYPLTKL